eukprot:82836_1
MSDSNVEFALIITITYASIYSFIILITSIVCAYKVRQIRKYKNKSASISNRSDNEQKTKEQDRTTTQKATALTADSQKKEKCYAPIKEWFTLVREKKKIYISLVPHLFDQATDFGVAVEYWL